MNGEANYCNPPVQQAVQACGRLATTPEKYGGTGKPYLPIFFDLENASTTPLDYGTSTDNQKEAFAEIIYNCAAWSRSVNDGSDYGYYALPISGYPLVNDARVTGYYRMHEILASTYNNVYTTYLTEMYVTNMEIRNPDHLFTKIEHSITIHKRYFGNLRPIAVVNPVQQVLFGDTTLPGENNRPVDLELWNRMLLYLVDRGCDLMIWSGTAPLATEATKSRIRNAMSYAK